MSFLDFLSNASLETNAKVNPTPAKSASRRAAADRNPTESDIRVFKNGSVYPSLNLIEEDSLDYIGKGEEGLALGYDVFKSAEFLNTKGWEQEVIFIASVEKSAGKVDLFAQTTYNKEDDSPAADVATQGSKTFGVLLLEMLKEVYDVELGEEDAYMDLTIVKDHPFTTDDNIYWVPKTVSRGAKKGEMSLERRENLVLNVLVPTSMLSEEVVGDDVDVMIERLEDED